VKIKITTKFSVRTLTVPIFIQDTHGPNCQSGHSKSQLSVRTLTVPIFIQDTHSPNFQSGHSQSQFSVRTLKVPNFSQDTHSPNCQSGQSQSQFSVRTVTVPIQLRTRGLPNARRGSYCLSQRGRFCIVNYPTFRPSRFPATPTAAHQYVSLVRQNVKTQFLPRSKHIQILLQKPVS